MLADAAAISQVLLSEATSPLLASKTVIQMGTIAPDESRELATAISGTLARICVKIYRSLYVVSILG